MTPRGACPGLAAPMATGDGLLLRAPPGWWSPATVKAIAEAAARHGNGVVEVTARGSLQLRGLRPDTAGACAAVLAEHGIADAPPVLVGPLAGHDPFAFADPRPVASAIAAAWPEGLAPKTSVVVDGGGVLHLDAVAADVRVVALGADLWAIGLGGASEGAMWTARVGTAEAAASALAALARLRGRRARDVAPGGSVPAPPRRPPAEPVGWHASAGALGVAGAFGSVRAAELAAFAGALPAYARVRPAPGRALLVLGLDRGAAGGLRARAAALGFVTDAGDPRRRIAACPGRPACGGAEAETRPLAARLAALPDLPAGGVHVSGCAKGCAHPARAAVTLVGRGGGFDLVRDGTARDRPARRRLAPREVPAALAGGAAP